MKVKMIIGIIATSVVLFLAIGFYQASKLQNIEIERTTQIQANPDQVYQMIALLSNYPKWSPFLMQDPTQRYSIKGTDGTIGAQYHWEGNKGKDLGYQEIVKLESNRFIRIQVFIQKPFVAAPTFAYRIKEETGMTKVIQVFTLKSGLFDAFFLWMFGVKKEMGKTNKQGLDLLKKAVEAS